MKNFEPHITEDSDLSEVATITFEEICSVLTEKSRSGYTAQIRELLLKHGANKLSKINPSEYASLLREVEELKNE